MTRPTSCTATKSSTRISKVDEIDGDLRDVDRPRVGAVRVALVLLVVPPQPFGRLVLRRAAQRAVLRHVGRGTPLGTPASRTSQAAALRPTAADFRPSAALSTSLPTTMHVRDATVGPLSGTDRRIGLRDLDVVAVDAERVAGDLREDRVRSLTDLGAGRKHADVAVGRGLDADDRGEVLLARAGEARAVHEAGEADAACGRGPLVLAREPRALLVVVRTARTRDRAAAACRPARA